MQTDEQFLERRRRITAWWKATAFALYGLLALVLLWLNRHSPGLVNPLHVAGKLKEGGLEQPVLELSAVMLPFMVLFIFVVVMLCIFFGFAISSNEKRYQRIIAEMRRRNPGGSLP